MSEAYADPTFDAAVANIEKEGFVMRPKKNVHIETKPDVRGWYDYIWRKAENEMLAKRKEK